jgi:hypothetical protein
LNAVTSEGPAAGDAAAGALPADAVPPGTPARSLTVIACGALAAEIIALKRASGWQALDVRCLPADLHNRPERIPAAVRALIQELRAPGRTLFVAYGDCGTGGQLDRVLREEGVERIPGAHCYEFFATAPVFGALADAEPGTFYLTDFLLRHFERLVIRGLGLDRHPELWNAYFGNYRKLVYLAQAPTENARAAASATALRMGLSFEYRNTGYGDLERSLSAVVARSGIVAGRGAVRHTDANASTGAGVGSAA